MLRDIHRRRHRRRLLCVAAMAVAVASIQIRAMEAAAAATSSCPRATTALTSSCEDQCFSGRPCLAYTAADATASSCVAGNMTVCATSLQSGCKFACFKYAPDDNVERNLLDFSSFTFLIPFGDYKSKWELKWNASDAQAADKATTSVVNELSKFPSASDDVVQAIEQLLFLNSTKTVRIAGGTSVDGIQGRVADAELSTQAFLTNKGIESLTLANLELKEIPPSTFPPQLLNLSITNCVMSTIPNDLLELPQLTRLDLSKNYFKTYPAKFGLPQLTFLNLSTNNLETFDGNFPALTTLDLSDNLLTTIPTPIFTMANLVALDLRGNSFTNLQLSQDQVDFLSKISQFTVDTIGGSSSSSSCPTKDQRTLAGVSVCVKTSSDSGSSSGGGGGGGGEGGGGGGSSFSGALIGGIIAGALIVVLAVAVFLWLRKRRQKTAASKSTHTLTLTPGGGMASSAAMTQSGGDGGSQNNHSDSANNSLWNDQELLSLKVHNDDIEDLHKIGVGAFSVVFLVKYRKTKFAASKRLKKDDQSWQNTSHFVSEIKLVKRLEHPRIVSLIGVAWTIEADLQALFEYMENGDLRTYVGNLSQPNWTREKAQIVMDIVEALVYVHSFTPPLVHRDLKSRNILLGEGFRAKLSDFGVARFRSEQGTMTTGVGTGRWLAPEVISGSNDYDQSSDIFALGVVLSELDTHELPYEDIRGASGNRVADIALLQMVAAGKLVPTFSRSCPPEILKLAMRCLSFDRMARPTAVQVAYALRSILRTPPFAS